MPCELEQLAVRPACRIYEGQRTQQRVLAQFLCKLAEEVVPDYTCDYDALLSEALVCMGEATLRQKTAEVTVEGLNLNWQELDCYSDAQVNAILLGLTCRLVNQLNP